MRKTQKKEVQHTMFEYVPEYWCDKCGHKISDGDLNYLKIEVNPMECVSYYRGRHYCIDCFEPVWQVINSLIGADPEVLDDPDIDANEDEL